MRSPNLTLHARLSVHSPLYTLLLPLRTAPYTDGTRWIKRDGLTWHGGIKEGEEYTDED